MRVKCAFEESTGLWLAHADAQSDKEQIIAICRIVLFIA